MNLFFKHFSQSRRSALTLAATILAGVTLCAPAQASTTWPTKPIRLVIGFGPGGGTDIMARALSPLLSEKLGQSVVVENKPGASGNIAVADVAKATPDGHTFLVAPTSVETANPYLFKSNVSPSRDLTPIMSVGRTQMYLLARPDLEAQTMEQFMATAKSNPEKLNIATSGAGTAPHLVSEMLNHTNGTSVTLVPYKGSAPALQDVMAGHADVVFDPGIGIPYVQAGKLKPLAVASETRSPIFPDVPSFGELGMKDASLDIWFGVWGPNNLPPEIVSRFSSAISEALASPVLKERFATLAAEPVGLDQKDFRDLLADEGKRLSTLIKERNIVVE